MEGQREAFEFTDCDSSTSCFVREPCSEKVTCALACSNNTLSTHFKFNKSNEDIYLAQQYKL